MQAAPTFIDTAEVATLLGLPSAAAFQFRRRELEDSHAFPLPMPHWRRPLKYRRDQVLAWIDRQGRPRPEAEAMEIDPALIAAGKVAVLAEARRP